MEAFEQACVSARPVTGSVASWLLRGWSLISVVVIVVAISSAFQDDYSWSVPLGVVAAIDALLWFTLGKRVHRILVQWERCGSFPEGYCNVAGQAASDLPEEAPLASLRRVLAKISQPGALRAAMHWLEWTGGGFFQVILDFCSLYSHHILEGIVRHVVPYRSEYVGGLAAVAELEALLSLACFAAEQPNTSWPEPMEDMRIAIDAGVHPLIDPTRAVPNTMELSARPNLWIVTGSNMSGKSTFLRMVGVNTVLAQAGGVVCAARMEWSPIRLITDLRVRDNLGKGESYFLAEVRQVRRMLVPPTDPAPLLGLVDEPLRGTNHREQRAATLALIEQFVETAGMFLIATHDATVTRIADGTCSRNYHFQEQLGERELLFDYRLREGPSTTHNAIRVLAREQFPAELVRRALSYADSPQPDPHENERAN